MHTNVLCLHDFWYTWNFMVHALCDMGPRGRMLRHIVWGPLMFIFITGVRDLQIRSPMLRTSNGNQRLSHHVIIDSGLSPFHIHAASGFISSTSNITNTVSLLCMTTTLNCLFLQVLVSAIAIIIRAKFLEARGG